MRPELKLLCIFSSFFLPGLHAQRTAVFNGKTYMVFPQVIQKSSYGDPVFYENTLALTGIEFPPVIGNHKDGEYLIYNGEYTLVNKRKRKSQLVYDTIFHVYGTFILKDNKKEGLACIYGRYRQKTIVARVPYKNDMIEGALKLSDYNRNYGNDADFRESSINYNTILTELNFKAGILVDSVRVYRIYKKDTVLSKFIEVHNGVMDGKYIKYNYWKIKRKMRLNTVVRGQYKNDEQEGEWIRSNSAGKLLEKEYYYKGKLTLDKYFGSDGNVYRTYVYGKDSVLKYFPNFIQEPVMPYIYSYEKTPVYEVIIYYQDKQEKKAFVFDNYASLNYYKDLRKWEPLSVDTLISGRRFRYETTSRTIRFSLVDTCRNVYDKAEVPFRFCLTPLWKKKFDKKGKLIRLDEETEFYRYKFADSFVAHVIEKRQVDNMIETEYYYPAMDLEYRDIIITSGKNKGGRIYHVASGNSKNGRLIRYICIPGNYDSVYLIDTLRLSGQQTYSEDYYFNTVFEEYLRDDYHYRKNALSYYIDKFISVKPVKHTCVKLGNTEFSGLLTVNIHYDNGSSPVKAMLYEHVAYKPFSMNREISLDIYCRKKNLKAVGKEIMILPEKTKEFYIHKGLFSFQFYSIDIFNNEAYSASYLNNRLSSELEIELYQMNREYKQKRKFRFPLLRRRHRRHGNYRVKKWKITEKRSLEKNWVKMQFEDGMKEGQLHVYVYDKLTEAVTFHGNRLNGVQYKTYGNTFRNVFSYRNDTLSGPSYVMNENGFPAFKADFRQGKPHGDLFYYGTHDTAGYFKEKFPFRDGYLDGDYVLYGDSNELKLIIRFDKKDSMFYSVYEKTGLETSRSKDYQESPLSRDGSFFNGLLRFDKFRKGLYSYYYKSGTVFKKGVKEYGQPTGRWTFCREGKDRVYKVIDFTDTMLDENTADSMHIYGLVKAYYDDGRLMFRGYALDKRSQYSCESASDLPIEEDHYLEFYDTLGNNVLKNGSGYIAELQASGHKMKEGRLDSFRREGIWVYYSKFGLPEAIGMFKNGKKAGRWLYGDLGGLNISEEICFMNDDEFRVWISMFGGNLSLNESFYVDGKLVSTNTVSVIKK